MSFQAYIDNIKTKTGKTPEDFKKLAEKKGLLQKGEIKPGVKAGEIVAWLKEDFDLGHGHAMAIYDLFKSPGFSGSEKNLNRNKLQNATYHFNHTWFINHRHSVNCY